MKWPIRLLCLVAFVVMLALTVVPVAADNGGRSPWVDWVVVGLGLLVPALIGWAFARLSEPLRRFKKIWAANPIAGIVASAIVMACELVWSAYDGAYQFDRACELLAGWLTKRGIVISQERIKEIVQTAYLTLKELFGEHWGDLKQDLAGVQTKTTKTKLPGWGTARQDMQDIPH